MVTYAMRFLEGIVGAVQAAVERGVRSLRDSTARPVPPLATYAMRLLEGVVTGAQTAVKRGVKWLGDGTGRSALPLVFVLASRNLFHDRVRLIATVVGIVFSIVLVTVQLGLFLSFERMVTTMIDHAEADFWIVPRETKSFEDSSLLDGRERFRALSIHGVTEVTPLVIGYADGASANGGASTPVFVIGAHKNSTAGLQPWNVVEGSLDQLANPDAVAIDRSYFEQLGVDGMGDVAEISNRKAHVVVVTKGIRSFTTTPNVFTSLDRARAYLGVPPNKANYFIVRVSPDTTSPPCAARSRTTPDTEVLTSEEFRLRSRLFWLFDTGAGAALRRGASSASSSAPSSSRRRSIPARRIISRNLQRFAPSARRADTSSRSFSGRRCSARSSASHRGGDRLDAGAGDRRRRLADRHDAQADGRPVRAHGRHVRHSGDLGDRVVTRIDPAMVFAQ